VIALMLAACAGRDVPPTGDGATSGDDEAGTTDGTTGESGTTSAETGETTTSNGDESADDGCQFGGGCSDNPGIDMCDIWLQDCPQGEKCTAYASMGSSWDANRCVPIQGDGQPGDDCVTTDGSPHSGNDDCDAGSLCWDIDVDTGVGDCIAFCTGTAQDPACAQDNSCEIFNQGVLPLCLSLCDPLAGGADCPNPDNLCIEAPSGGSFVCIPADYGGPGAYGSDCSSSGCAQGLFCASGEAVPGCQSNACCSEYCDLGQPNTCMGKDGGQVCVPWYEMGMAPPGYEQVGACAIP
jgi:hypothetical protein